jgi:membrane protease YdiL (CAAX protease family)
MAPEDGDSTVFLGGAPAPAAPPASAQQPAEEVTWGLRSIVYALGIALSALVVTVAVLVYPVSAIFGSKSVETDAASAVSQILLDVFAVAGVFWLVSGSGSSWRALGLRRPQRPEDGSDPDAGYPWGYHLGMVGVGLVLSYICLFAYLAIVSALGLHFLEPPEHQIPENYLQNNVVTAILGFGVVAVAPVCEEIFFRGFIFGAFRKLWGFGIAAAASGLLFSLAHTQAGLIIPFTGIGFTLAFIYQRTRSIFVSMTVHACFNSVSFALLVAQARDDNAASAMLALRHLGL